MPVMRNSYARSGLPCAACNAARDSASGNPIATKPFRASGGKLNAGGAAGAGAGAGAGATTGAGGALLGAAVLG